MKTLANYLNDPDNDLTVELDAELLKKIQLDTLYSLLIKSTEALNLPAISKEHTDIMVIHLILNEIELLKYGFNIKEV
jgi:hypothetical protein